VDGPVNRRRNGQGNWRLCRYADDLVLMVSGDRRHAEALREEVAAVLAPLGLRLAPEKTRVVHIDEGFTFLGFDIRRQRKRGTQKHYVYTKPSRKAIGRRREFFAYAVQGLGHRVWACLVIRAVQGVQLAAQQLPTQGAQGITTGATRQPAEQAHHLRRASQHWRVAIPVLVAQVKLSPVAGPGSPSRKRVAVDHRSVSR
jgi:Reverse transcriptase (RNA-dependent DNA polymerase)